MTTELSPIEDLNEATRILATRAIRGQMNVTDAGRCRLWIPSARWNGSKFVNGLQFIGDTFSQVARRAAEVAE